MSSEVSETFLYQLPLSHGCRKLKEKNQIHVKLICWTIP